MPETLCAFIFPGSAGIPCLSTVHRGSRYCWIHHAVMYGPVPTKPRARRRRKNDLDLLPFTPEELQYLASLREKTK
jgi:hypothetical protein